MIEPYATAIKAFSDKFSDLGFTPISDADYAMTFSNGDYSINVATEKYYHPSLLMSLRDQRGKRFELGTVKKILAPERVEEDQQALKLIREKYGLDEPGTERVIREKGVLEYVRATLNQVLDFMIDFREQIFVSPNRYQSEYAARERALLTKLPVT